MNMTYSEARQVLEDNENMLQQRSETLAELGSSAFFGGAQGNGGYDAMAIARMVYDQDRDLAAEAEWDAKVTEARRVIDECPVKVVYHFPRNPLAVPLPDQQRRSR